MCDRSHQNLRILQQVIETQILVVSQVFRKIDDYCCQSRSRARRVGREPDSREERLSVSPFAATSKLRVELPRPLRLYSALQCRQEFGDGLACNGKISWRKEILSGLVGQQDLARGVYGHNRRRAAFHQDTKLLFGLLP